MKRTLPELLDSFLEDDDGRAFLKSGSAKWSRPDLYEKCMQWAGLLCDIGVKPGDRVGIYLKKSLEEVGFIFAVACAGAVFVNIHPSNKAQQLNHIIKDCDIQVLVSSPELIRALGSALGGLSVKHIIMTGDPKGLAFSGKIHKISDNITTAMSDSQRPRIIDADFATILYTSGSTGKPKGIVQTHGNLIEGAEIISTYVRNTSNDRVLSLLPFSFDYGLNQLLSGIFVGFQLVLAAYLFPLDILKLLQKEKITGLAGVPTIWIDLLGVLEKYPDADLPNLRYITNSGGKLFKPTVEKLSSRLTSTDIYLMYGLTEAFRSTYLPPEQVKIRPESIGKAVPNVEIIVVNDAGEICKPNEVGELVHRGALISKGYWGDPEKTNKILRPNPLLKDNLHFLETVIYSGDLVWQDDEGFLYFVGRRDNMIKSSGHRISPDEVVETLLEAKDVVNAAVIGVEDEHLGQKIVAFIQISKQVKTNEKDIIYFAKKYLPPQMVPSRVILMERFPINKNGKVDMNKLKEDLKSGKLNV